jgi:predicted nucleic acid-binding protein
MRKIFIDTGAYLSYYHKKDTHHQKSVETWKNITQVTKNRLITTHHIIDELATLLGRKKDYQYAAGKIKKIFNSNCIIERTHEIDERMALELFEKYADQQISFTDCLSFVVMQQQNIQTVFTFDKHFQYAGFEVIPPLYN